MTGDARTSVRPVSAPELGVRERAASKHAHRVFPRNQTGT